MTKETKQPRSGDGYRMTWYEIRGSGEYPHTEVGMICHKVDLSDLKEPYLSAVKRSIAAQDAS